MLCLALLLTGQLLEFPSDIKGEPGQFITIKPTKTDGKMVQYYAMDPGLSVFPAALLVDPTVTVVSAVQPGVYRILAWTALADKPSPASLIRVTIGRPGPPMPPIPPTPPVPVPPADPLQLDIESIYGALNEPDKDETRQIMIRVYRACGVKAKTAVTVGDLFTKLQEQTKALPAGKLTPIRKRLVPEIEKIVGNDPDTQLTVQQQNDLANMYNRVCVYLEGLK